VFVFTIDASAAPGGITVNGSPATITIAANDQPLAVTCAAATTTLTEGTATTVANCRHTNSAPLAAEVRITYRVYEGAGVTPADSPAPTRADTDFGNAEGQARGTLNLPANTAANTDVPLMLTALADGPDATKRFTLYFTNAADTGGRYVTVNVDTGINLTVTGDALPAPSITVTDLPENEGAAGCSPSTTACATVNLTGSVEAFTGVHAAPNAPTLTYAWQQVASATDGAADVTSGMPDYVALTHASNTAADATFTAPDVDSPTMLYFRLTVTAAKTNYDSSTASAVATITINDVEPPTATITAPSDTDVDEGAMTTLVAAATDPDSDAGLTYEWTVTAKSQSAAADPTFADPSDPTTANPENLLQPRVDWPEITPTQREVEYTLTLTVRDSQGLEATDTVMFTVLDDDGVPTANIAGDATRIVGHGGSVTLDGSGSTNGGGVANTELTYAWTQVTTAAGDTAVATGDRVMGWSGADTASLTFTAPSADDALYFRLQVTDDQTQQTDDAHVTINPRDATPAPNRHQRHRHRVRAGQRR